MNHMKFMRAAFLLIGVLFLLAAISINADIETDNHLAPQADFNGLINQGFKEPARVLQEPAHGLTSSLFSISIIQDGAMQHSEILKNHRCLYESLLQLTGNYSRFNAASL